MLWVRNSDHIETYAKQEKIALAAFFAEAPNLIATIFACFLTRSAIVLVDFLSSFQSTLHNAIVAMISHKLKKDNGDKFNYGIAKIESLASLACDILVIIGFLCVIFFAIYSFFVVRAPSDRLYLFLLLKLVNIAFDLVFLTQNIRNGNKRESKISETEVTAYKAYLLDDLIIFAAAMLSFFLRSFPLMAYFAPAYSLINAIYFIFICSKHIRHTIFDLIDVAPPVEAQNQVADVLITHTEAYKRIVFINFKTISHHTTVELGLTFHDQTTFSQQMDLLDCLRQEIQSQIGECEVILRPCREQKKPSGTPNSSGR